VAQAFKESPSTLILHCYYQRRSLKSALQLQTVKHCIRLRRFTYEIPMNMSGEEREVTIEQLSEDEDEAGVEDKLIILDNLAIGNTASPFCIPWGLWKPGVYSFQQ
jgi:hypothetical protein